MENHRTKFYALEDDPCINLDLDNKNYALHYVFLPIINYQYMKEFRQAWNNNHKLRWLSGTMDSSTYMHNASRELVNGEVNLEQSLN